MPLGSEGVQENALKDFENVDQHQQQRRMQQRKRMIVKKRMMIGVSNLKRTAPNISS